MVGLVCNYLADLPFPQCYCMRFSLHRLLLGQALEYLVCGHPKACDLQRKAETLCHCLRCSKAQSS